MSIRTDIAQARRQLARLGQARLQALDVATAGALLATAWLAIARPDQLLPAGPWRTWFIRAGRGWGKTRTGAEAVTTLVRAGTARKIAIVARTEDDLRNVAIAALQAAYGPGLRYYAASRRLVFDNGAVGFGFSASQPDSPRGYEFDLVWFDEFASYRDPEETYHQFQFALRMPGSRQIITTTPRPMPLIRTIVADPTTHETTGKTSDNAANLDQGSMTSHEQYRGTRLGRQELDGEILDDLDGGLWESAWIDPYRVVEAPALVKIVVAIDPALGGGRASDETGIIVAGKSGDGHGYVLADRSGRMSPDQMARVAVGAYREFGAQQIVTEENVGGSFVRSTIQAVDPTVLYRAVRASQSKLVRAAPFAALYEQGRVHHVGTHLRLEDQLCTARLDPGSGHNDRLDALVWALTDLDLTGSPLDVPGVISWQYGVVPCTCGHYYLWETNTRCPECKTPRPATY